MELLFFRASYVITPSSGLVAVIMVAMSSFVVVVVVATRFSISGRLLALPTDVIATIITAPSREEDVKNRRQKSKAYSLPTSSLIP